MKRSSRRVLLLVVMAVAMTAFYDMTAFAAQENKILYYRNPMGLADTSPVPKKDSMGMDYIPVYADEAQDEPGTIRIASERLQMLGVTTELAEWRRLTRTLHAPGTVQPDERRLSLVSPRFEGWVEKLFVDRTGAQVKKGDPLLEFYSPQLLTAESEYLFLPRAGGSVERLKSLGVPQEEIDRLVKTRITNSHIILRAANDGTVLEKTAVEGLRFMPGDTLYRLADLSSVWVIASVFERDLVHLAPGQKVIVSTASQKIEGKIDFIYPGVDKDTRAARVRIELPNPDGILRTDMYVQVDITLSDDTRRFAVPADAVLDSGDRKTVLVDLGKGRFRSQPITTGVEGDGYVEITNGLKDDDRVVTRASFLIDAEANMRAALQNFAPGEKKHD
jgi:Cu(I)/Ag(I) efflux system membrane fusion protein